MARPFKRLLDPLLTTHVQLRGWLVQMGMATLALTACGAALLALAALGMAPALSVAAWLAVVPTAALCAFAAIRAGLTRRLSDPALTMPVLAGGSLACAAAYAIAGPARGGVLLPLMGVWAAAMLGATPRQMRWGSLFTVLAMGAAMLHAAWRRDGAPVVELLHFFLLATLVPAAGVLAARLHGARARARRQQADLQGALARIRDLATRDELTGLFNRRQMRELMQHEHQRAIRSGRTFCLAALDIDGFGLFNERHGRSAGDALLRSVANEAMRRVRVSDAFGRWSGDRFVMLLTDTHAPLARGGVERVRASIGEAASVAGPGDRTVTLSAGLAEHRAGETIDQTLDRAQAALADAKQQGRDRLVAQE